MKTQISGTPPAILFGMNKSLTTAAAVITSAFAFAFSAQAQTLDTTPDVLPVQSSARPFGLSIVGPVYAAASDSRSADFQTNELPDMMKTINNNLGEYKPIANLASKALDPSKLVLSTDAQVRVYFLGEGAGYHNTLGVNYTGTGIKSGTPQLVFPDASSKQSWYNYSTGTGAARTASEPLRAGDFVDFGTLKAGQKLDFFLIADGASSASAARVWTANKALNSDGIQHMASFAVQDSAYLLLSFEDLTGGGDKDYNDLVFAVEIGVANVQALANPEPATVLTFLLIAGVVFFARRRIDGGLQPA
jgi:hypothetical protein